MKHLKNKKIQGLGMLVLALGINSSLIKTNILRAEVTHINSASMTTSASSRFKFDKLTTAIPCNDVTDTRIGKYNDSDKNTKSTVTLTEYGCKTKDGKIKKYSTAEISTLSDTKGVVCTDCMTTKTTFSATADIKGILEKLNQYELEHFKKVDNKNKKNEERNKLILAKNACEVPDNATSIDDEFKNNSDQVKCLIKQLAKIKGEGKRSREIREDKYEKQLSHFNDEIKELLTDMIKTNDSKEIKAAQKLLKKLVKEKSIKKNKELISDVKKLQQAADQAMVIAKTPKEVQKQVERLYSTYAPYANGPYKAMAQQNLVNSLSGLMSNLNQTLSGASLNSPEISAVRTQTLSALSNKIQSAQDQIIKGNFAQPDFTNLSVAATTPGSTLKLPTTRPTTNTQQPNFPATPTYGSLTRNTNSSLIGSNPFANLPTLSSRAQTFKSNGGQSGYAPFRQDYVPQ